MSKAKKAVPPAKPTLDIVIDVVDTNAQALATLAGNMGEFADACEERFEEIDSELGSTSVTITRHEEQISRLTVRTDALLRLVLETAAPAPSLWQRVKEKFSSIVVRE